MKKTLGKLFIGAVLLMAGMIIVSGCSPAAESSRLKYYDGKWPAEGLYNDIWIAEGHSKGKGTAEGYLKGKGAYGGHYKGEMLNNKPHGFATYTHPDGGEYVGQFKDGKFEGQGTYTFSNGTFVGEMKQDEAYKGTFTGKDGTIIVGIFAIGTKAGTISYPDHRKYEGEWKGGPEFISADETIVPSQWIYERPHGVGKMTYPDGKIEEGTWNKGKFLGKLSRE